MEKIRKGRKLVLSLFSLLFVAMLSFALAQLLPAMAEDNDITVTIHINEISGWTEDSYGSVTFEGNNGESISDSTTTLTATVKEGGKLELNATPASGLIFQYWSTAYLNNSTSYTGSTAVSMKNQDSFTYEEIKAFDYNAKSGTPQREIFSPILRLKRARNIRTPLL